MDTLLDAVSPEVPLLVFTVDAATAETYARVKGVDALGGFAGTFGTSFGVGARIRFP